jgi:hypothetical protein
VSDASPPATAKTASAGTAAIRAIECVEAVERLDSDCLPRLSSRRESQFGMAKKAYDTCKEILDFKKDKKLCK